MKMRYSVVIVLIVLSHHAFCENIQIQSIEPMPGFEKVGGPAFGESVESYRGQGLVQYLSDSKIMINSKMYFIDKSCEKLISSEEIRRASIVKFELNKQARINNIEVVVQLTITGKIDRIDSNALVLDDQYFPLDLFITYHDITGNQIGHYDINKGDFVGLTVNKEENVKSLWYLNGHYMY